MRRIVDIKDMPRWNPAISDNIDSVSADKVRVVYVEGIGETIYCREHGAMLRVSKEGLWRCPACNVGCFEVLQ